MKLLITVEGKQYEVEVDVLDDGGGAPAAAAPRPAAAPAPRSAPAATPPPARPAPAAAGGGDKAFKAPMPGTVRAVMVKEGDTVAVNQALLVLDAMKMETEMASPFAGTIKKVAVAPGDAVTAGQVLVELA